MERRVRPQSVVRFSHVRLSQFARHACLIAVILLAGHPLAGQVTVTESEDGSGILTYQLSISPAAEAQPAFRYRLRDRATDLARGNAAPFYYRAMLEEDALNLSLRKHLGDDWGDLYVAESGISLGDLPVDAIKQLQSEVSDNIWEPIRIAASRRDCQWQWDLEEVRGPKLIMFLLDEMNSMRQFARFAAIRTRCAIAEKRYVDAVELMNIQMKMAHDAAEQPLLVCGLVGIAIHGMANESLVELISAPDSPNLYWALAGLRQPVIDLTPAAEFELSIGERIFPLLKDADSTQRSPQQWADLVGQSYLDLLENLGGAPVEPSGAPWMKELFPPEVRSRSVGTGLAVLFYSDAKRELIRSGRPAAEVENMAVGQVLALQASHAYRTISQEFEKVWHLPFAESAARFSEIQEQLQERGYWNQSMASREIIPVASLLLPAINAARAAQERLNREIAALQTIEAIRMHVASTGKLPETLADITVVPVPNNPITNKFFDYRVNDGRAMLDAKRDEGIFGAKRFEIALRDRKAGGDMQETKK